MYRFRVLPFVLGCALATVFATSSFAQTQVPGEYCLRGVREVGACFRFVEDGAYQYFLSYGAYDEVSEGKWRRDGDAVVLDSLPYDRPSTFSFLRHEPGQGDAPQVIIVDRAGNKLQGFDVSATCEGRRVGGRSGGQAYPLACPQLPADISIGLAIMGLAPRAVTVPPSSAQDRVAVFTFEPGDLGKRAFRNQRLAIDGEAVVLVFANAPFTELAGKSLRFIRNR
jgi:hypothetical protein